MLLISPHKYYPFPWIVPHNRQPQLVLFSCLEFDCTAVEVVKTYTGKPPHYDRINTCLQSPHQGPFSPRIWDHQSVSYWPDTGCFWQCYWYQLILVRSILFWYNNSSVVWAFWKTLNLRGIEPTPRFSPGFYTFQVSFPLGTQVFLILFISILFYWPGDDHFYECPDGKYSSQGFAIQWDPWASGKVLNFKFISRFINR